MPLNYIARMVTFILFKFYNKKCLETLISISYLGAFASYQYSSVKEPLFTSKATVLASGKQGLQND